ncbi:hypothetical protein M8J77_020798 [Diaphorina citri]|nr:hypothetical protein M8J77_020798 [Diaphorina citri]
MVWTCCKCIAKYTSRSHLSLHLLSHSSDADEIKQELSCEQCGCSIDFHSELYKKDVYHCAHCEQVFLDKFVLELHLKIEHKDTLFPKSHWCVCKMCGHRLFMRLSDLRRHMQDYHCEFHFDVESCAVSCLQDITFPCEECKELCVLSKYCIKHKDCSKAMSTPAPSSESVCIEHSNLIPKCHSCQKCEESFDNCNNLWSHMFIKHENSDFVCNLCPPDSKIVIKYAHLLVRHMKKYHTMQVHIPTVIKHFRSVTSIKMNNVTQYKCPDCPAVLQTFKSLKSHLEIHGGEKEFSCHICNKVFTRKGTLMHHIRTVHEKHRGYRCNVCSRSFTNVCNLKDHMQLHTGSRKYVCEVCGETFYYRGSLKVHKFTHSTTPFVCSYCGNVFKNPITLKGHIAVTHLKVSKCVCDICGKELNSAKVMRDHMAVHSTERPFVCEICNSSFKLIKHLKQHYKTHKKNK